MSTWRDVTVEAEIANASLSDESMSASLSRPGVSYLLHCVSNLHQTRKRCV